MRAIIVTVVVLVLAGTFVVWGLWDEYRRFTATPLDIGRDTEVLGIPRGSTLSEVARDLADRGWIPNTLYFIVLAYREGKQDSVKAGEYEVRNGMLPTALLARIASGRSLQFPVTFIEGQTFREAVTGLAEAGPFEIELAGLDDAEIMARVGIDAEHPEGWLFPDTYLFPRGTRDTAILARAHGRMQQVLAEEWAERSSDLPIATPYEALILASIIEKETAVPAERPAIAGVFVRRLRQGMRLQTDPTVIYGLGDDFDGNIRRADLRRETPYNTYVIQGLPPTPIALPGREAIHAALHPEPGDALFFVARGDGSHHFSATLDEHNCAVRHYQLGRPCPELKVQASDGRPASPDG